MPAAILGRKVGMTRLFDQSGKNVPVTVIQAGPCYVSQIKTAASDGYDAIQIAFDDVKPRNSTMPVIGHDHKAGLTPKRVHKEFRASAEEVAAAQLGQQITVEALAAIRFVDVTGTSKGKGTAGVMKRWGFKGQPATHGTERKHRSPGSIGGLGSTRGGSRPKKGRRMAGHLGAVRVTERNLEVVGSDKDKNLLLVKGPIPGSAQGLVMIRESKRLYKRKARLAKAEAS